METISTDPHSRGLLSFFGNLNICNAFLIFVFSYHHHGQEFVFAYVVLFSIVLQKNDLKRIISVCKQTLHLDEKLKTVKRRIFGVIEHQQKVNVHEAHPRCGSFADLAVTVFLHHPGSRGGT